MDLLYRKGKLNVVADCMSRLTVNHHQIPHQKAVRPAEATLLPLLVADDATPVAVQAAVGEHVKIRIDAEHFFKKKFQTNNLTPRQRYAVVKSVYSNKQLRIQFASGDILTTAPKRLQHVPFADYAAAIAADHAITGGSSTIVPAVNLLQDMKKHQQADRDLRSLYDMKSTPATRLRIVLRNWNLSGAQIETKDGLLYMIDKKEQHRLLVPTHLRITYLQLCHNAVLEGGHRNDTATLELLNRLVYWPKMPQQVKEFCQTCHFCQIHSKKYTAAPLPQGSLNCYYPFQRIALDFVGPMPATAQGNKHLLVVIDHFTKYTMVFPTKEQTSETVAKILFQRVFSVFGTPETVLADNASDFISKAMQQMYDTLGIGALHSTTYHPQGNSVVERVNQTLKNMLAKYVSELKLDWDDLVPAVTLAYNQTTHSSTGYSPFFLLFGRDNRTPLDLLLGLPENKRASMEDYLIKMFDAITLAHRSLRDANMKQDKILMEKNHKKLADADKILFNIGEYVLWKNHIPDPKAKHKLNPQWLGPYRILDRYGAGCYKIEMLSQRGKYRIAPALQLKRYHSRMDYFQEIPPPDTIVSTPNDALNVSDKVIRNLKMKKKTRKTRTSFSPTLSSIPEETETPDDTSE